MKRLILCICIFLLALSLLAGCNVSESRIEKERDKAYSSGYEDGYHDGLNEAASYEDGYAEGYTAAYYIGIEDLMPNPEYEDLGFDVKWQDVDSTMFSRIGYDSERSILAVQFLDSGMRYYYFWFYYSDYRAFTSADSLGEYYNEYIKGNYYSFREDGSSTGANPYD